MTNVLIIYSQILEKEEVYSEEEGLNSNGSLEREKKATFDLKYFLKGKNNKQWRTINYIIYQSNYPLTWIKKQFHPNFSRSQKN